MVDLRPLLFLNALIIMLFLTAGFAHIKPPFPTDAQAVQEAPAVDSRQAIAEATAILTPDHHADSTFVDELPVFADEPGTPFGEASAVESADGENTNDASSESTDLVASLDATKPTANIAAPVKEDAAPKVSELPPVEVEPKLEPPPTGKLIVRSNVAGDKVRINGKEYGSTMLNLELSPGNYVIEVTKAGYKGWTKNIKLARGGQQVVNANLEQITEVEYSNGTWRYGVVTGQGRYAGTDGTQYTGGFLDKQFHGKGRLTLADGTTYEGEWSQGKKDGYGVLTLTNGDSYTGYFRDDEFNGEGTLTKSNGDIYAGVWARGKLNGEGSLTTKQGLMYVGGFVDNEFNGNGDITYPDGTHYQGGFTKSLFNGKGMLTYRDGKKYTGQFIDGQFHGKGELQNPNGSKITGTFKFGKPYGQAALTTPEGEVFTARSTEPGICYRLKSYRATQCPPMEGW